MGVSDYSTFLLYILLTFIACLVHLVGTYYFILSEKGLNFDVILSSSILIGAMASIIRIPTNAYLGKGFSVVYMETMYLFLLFLATIAYSLYIEKESVPLHTYVISAIIVGLLALNNYIGKKTHVRIYA
jgi:hypothetical protein